jgi:excinuclease ABC subunit C
MPAPSPNTPDGPASRPTLKEKVRRLPDGPGVYLMKDRLGRIIYVGKAKNLKKRVSTYFQPARSFTQQPKIRALVQMITGFDVIEVKS